MKIRGNGRTEVESTLVITALFGTAVAVELERYVTVVTSSVTAARLSASYCKFDCLHGILALPAAGGAALTREAHMHRG
jgi:hypothetical protein